MNLSLVSVLTLATTKFKRSNITFPNSLIPTIPNEIYNGCIDCTYQLFPNLGEFAFSKVHVRYGVELNTCPSLDNVYTSKAKKTFEEEMGSLFLNALHKEDNSHYPSLLFALGSGRI